MRIVGFTFLGLLVLLSGCSDGSAKAECVSDGDCPSGRYCRVEECVFDCTFNGDCPEGFRCTARGRCERGCVETNSGIEACDALDNDCDELTDEDFPNLGQVCSNGACPEGVYRCTGDQLDVYCDGPQPAADDALCDGLDADCDGLTDEDALDRPCALQEGLCAGSLDVCLGAQGWAGCDYGLEFTEGVDDACDQTDNDCDGQTDEDAAMITQPESDDQASDGLDNNCNGLTDEPGGLWVPIEYRPGTWVMAYEVVISAQPDCGQQIYGQAADDYPAEWPQVEAASVDLYACSMAGVIPSGYLTWYRAKRACEAQGFRLCGAADWQLSCNAGSSQTYPYGIAHIAGVCNDAVSGSGAPEPTGSRPACTPDGLVFDPSGNMAEWTDGHDPEAPHLWALGGWGYECILCTSDGTCHDCIAGNEADEKNMIENASCDFDEADRDAFPQEAMMPSFGVRCCWEGP